MNITGGREGREMSLEFGRGQKSKSKETSDWEEFYQNNCWLVDFKKRSTIFLLINYRIGAYVQVSYTVLDNISLPRGRK
jgi:hypothetical protein